jgi:serine protease Do
MKIFRVAIGLLVLAQIPARAVTGDLVRQLNDSFAGVYERVAPAVVVIEVEGAPGAVALRLPQGLEFFFRQPDGSRIPPQIEQGSGFLVSPDGVIVTNNHVVESGQSGKITVHLRDGRKFDAKLLGRDERSDIAVLKIDATGLPTVELADSDAVRVGQFAFAIGAPFDLPYTFTVGVVSAKGRSNLTRSTTYEEYIQTDAAINPGNSGGPLCDIDGRVIGVNTLISGLNRGLGFAVPVNIAKDVATQLVERGRVSRPWLGIGIMGLAEGGDESMALFPGLDRGVVVRSIDFGTPASKSRLRAGDVILSVDGTEVNRASDLQREILSKKVGQTVDLDVWRGGRTVKVSVQTGEQPDSVMRASRSAAPAVPPVPVPPAPPPDPSAGPVSFGVEVEDAGDGISGARVVGIVPGSQGEAAGFEVGDVIDEVAGQPVRSAQDFHQILGQADMARGVMAMVDRGGQKTFAILKR